jgi:hypothetical protein
MKNAKPDTVYPHIIVRLMAAVCTKINIQFTTDKPSNEPNTLSLQETDPYGNDGVLKKDVKKALIEIISRVLIPKHRFRMCLVVSPNECYYCEPDGTVEPSTNVPDGETVIETSDAGPVAIDMGERLFNKRRKEPSQKAELKVNSDAEPEYRPGTLFYNWPNKDKKT